MSQQILSVLESLIYLGPIFKKSHHSVQLRKFEPGILSAAWTGVVFQEQPGARASADLAGPLLAISLWERLKD